MNTDGGPRDSYLRTLLLRVDQLRVNPVLVRLRRGLGVLNPAQILELRLELRYPVHLMTVWPVIVWRASPEAFLSGTLYRPEP